MKTLVFAHIRNDSFGKIFTTGISESKRMHVGLMRTAMLISPRCPLHVNSISLNRANPAVL